MQVGAADAGARDPYHGILRVLSPGHGFMVDAAPPRPPEVHCEHRTDSFPVNVMIEYFPPVEGPPRKSRRAGTSTDSRPATAGAWTPAARRRACADPRSGCRPAVDRTMRICVKTKRRRRAEGRAHPAG